MSVRPMSAPPTAAPPREYPVQGYVFDPQDFPDVHSDTESKASSSSFSTAQKHLIGKTKSVSTNIVRAGASIAGAVIDTGQRAAGKGKELAKEKGSQVAEKGREYAQSAKEKATPVLQGTVGTVKEWCGTLEAYCDSLWQGTAFCARYVLARPVAWWFSNSAGVSSQTCARPGSVVQLVSRRAGGAVQIVVDEQGELTLDACGPLDARAFNTLWTVVKAPTPECVRLMNYNHYISVRDGEVKVVNMEGAAPGPETELRLQTLSVLVSVTFPAEPGSALGFFKNGELRPAAEGGNEHCNCFGLSLVKSAPV